MNIQFKKGVLELCVLLILDESECYGYELITRISKSIEMSEGTIYPLLKRLKEEGFVTTYLEESQQGPPRKYYRITSLGKKEKEQLILAWDAMVKGVDLLKKEGKVE